jgi:2-polyprenyl-3-methyl-5-hydroxy-6-metoxy-1,4-benzoquinol methylase
MLNEKTRRFVAEHGDWTAMAIRLPDGSYTRAPAAVDHRLKRLLQVAADVSKKPISACRVLDLACLEGHYAIEFAAHGAEATGIEGRAVSVTKCDYAKDALGLERAMFVQGDVRDFSAEKYGKFDIIICSGILYHLPADDIWQLIKAMHVACTGILLLDTFVSLNGRNEVNVAGVALRGHYYGEHEHGGDKAASLWASLDNERSFWFTAPSLMNMLLKAGFTSVMDVLVPHMPGNLADRKTYLAVAGEPVLIQTSEPTERAATTYLQEGENRPMDDSQRRKSALHKAAKRILPQGIKDLIKPALRLMGVLPPDGTPEFMTKNRH